MTRREYIAIGITVLLICSVLFIEHRPIVYPRRTIAEQKEHNAKRGDWTWHGKEKQVIGWERTNTIDVGNGLFRMEFPDIFVPDSSDNIHSRLLLVDTIGKGMEMIAFSMKNSEKWDTETAAELIAMARRNENGDSIMMRDMHDGYFYLKGETVEGDYRFYEQYVVEEKIFYILALRYPTRIEEEMERLFQLVHDWNPK